MVRKWVILLAVFMMAGTSELTANPVFGPVQPWDVVFPVPQANGTIALQKHTVATQMVQWIAPKPVGRNAYGQIIYQNQRFQARYIIQIFAVPVGYDPQGKVMFRLYPCTIGIVGNNGVAIATIPNPPIPKLEPIVFAPPPPQHANVYQQSNAGYGNLPPLDTSLDYRTMINNNTESIADFNQKLNGMLSSVNTSAATATPTSYGDNYSLSNFNKMLNDNLARAQSVASDPVAARQMAQQWESVGNIAGSMANSYKLQGESDERTRTLQRQVEINETDNAIRRVQNSR